MVYIVIWHGFSDIMHIKDSSNCETGMRGMVTLRPTAAYRHGIVQGCSPTVAYRVQGDGIIISNKTDYKILLK